MPDADQIAVAVANRELAHSVWLGAELVDDVGAVGTTLRVHAICVIDYDADHRRDRILVLGQEKLDVAVLDGTVTVVPRPPDLEPEDVTVVPLCGQDVPHRELRKHAQPGTPCVPGTHSLGHRCLLGRLAVHPLTARTGRESESRNRSPVVRKRYPVDFRAARRNGCRASAFAWLRYSATSMPERCFARAATFGPGRARVLREPEAVAQAQPLEESPTASVLPWCCMTTPKQDSSTRTAPCRRPSAEMSGDGGDVRLGRAGCAVGTHN
jgi:hypothetical protein